VSPAAWFLAGWISASAFIAVGILVHHLRTRARDEFQTTSQWMTEHGADQQLQQIGRRWYPVQPRNQARAS
jgi:hypothetical protein